ncbi:MAG: transcription-repair coupling factor [Planctomycetes bacterium]|nr:transcription-repair coupling factor [Planctomycetota bacterium]
MTTATAPATAWAELILHALEQPASRINGAKGSSLAKCLAEARTAFHRPLLLVAPDPEIAGDIFSDLKFYLGVDAPPPLFWPAWDILRFETDQPYVEIAHDQVAVLRACLDSERVRTQWIVTPITALLQPTLSPKIIGAGGLSVSAGTEVSPEAMTAHLVEGGLEPVSLVDAPGQFSRRGGILDVFPLLGDIPYRIEFFGDEIDTVRAFDTGTQQSGPPLTGNVTLVDVSRDSFRHIDGSHYSLLEYLPDDTAVIVWHPERITRVSGLYAGGFTGGPLFSFESVAEKLSSHTLAMVPDLENDPWPDPPWRQVEAPEEIDLAASGWERLFAGFDTAVNELSILVNKDVDLTIVCNNDGEEARLKKMLADKRPTLLEKADIVLGRLSRGFVHESESGGIGYVSDHELFNRNSPVRVARKRFAGAPIADFAELREGDYVVHVANGIAKFEGIQTLESNGAEQDFLTLRFAEDARIYVPLSHIELVQRYIGVGESKPQLSKLGSSAWSRKKAAVEKAVRDIAQDLLDTQAKRLASQGIALPPDDKLIEEFDLSFPYDETPDQLSALEDIRHDQQSTAPMERLLCGDVGFGKTEMAVRAAFRAVNAGYQVAVLVPTTILAEQHYRTFSSRMADYPVVVECLTRFRSPAEQRRIAENVREGKVDVVIGTHRILSNDVDFKNLGLVVIDEEQKFGVESKERLKRFRADVDILTMTATPIPRTLHMSLLGLRDISNLTTAPRERHSVKTMVVRWSKDIVRRAILRELARGGQCFFLHNRVHNIDEMAAQLQHLVPEARFGVGHGQMAEGELLEVMSNFLDGKLDVLVCTTIIESGVDIPSVNTLFVNEADHFGLSELHQLRGRVGRYKHQAYAYFLVPEKRPISPEATKRLQALQEYTELGAGFRIAMRDLEIRGAGNLLGVEQSGHIHMIGFDLYCRLLERAVAAQKGETVPEDIEADLDLGTRAFIPPEYIPSEQQRIEFYRRLTRIRSLDELESTRRYTRDRYGPLPRPVERCFDDQRLRIRMMAVGLASIGRLDSALAVGFTDKSVRRGVMLLRHAGLKISPLRKNQWRVEVPGIDSGTEAGDHASGMADKVLAILEAGLETSSDTDVGDVIEYGRSKYAKGRKAETPLEFDEEVASVDHDGAVAPSADTADQDAESSPMEYYSSDMLDEDEKESSPPPRVASRSKKSTDDDRAETEADDAGTGGIKKKRVIGKSGAKSTSLRSALLAQREEAVSGGIRLAAHMPGTSTKPGIISLGLGKKPDASIKKPFKKAPAKTARTGADTSDDVPPIKLKASPVRKPVYEPADPYGGVRVLGIEPYLSDGQVGVVIPETAFNPIRSEFMTLVVQSDPARSYYLPWVGMNATSRGRVVLKLQTAGWEAAKEVSEAYLGAGSAKLFDGPAPDGPPIESKD